VEVRKSPMFADKTFFDVMDFLSFSVLPPVGAVLTSVLVGWRLSRTIVDEELIDTTPFAARVCVWLLRYVCPIAIAAVLASALKVRCPESTTTTIPWCSSVLEPQLGRITLLTGEGD
jgi:SNF family Na+-dependent transporter